MLKHGQCSFSLLLVWLVRSHQDPLSGRLVRSVHIHNNYIIIVRLLKLQKLRVAWSLGTFLYI